MSLIELLAQRAELEKRIESLQGSARTEAIAKIRALMAETGLTMADIGGGGRKKAAAEGSTPAGNRALVAAKYRNVATGEPWAGRGKRPRWLQEALAAGATLESFLV